jgi:hypothetical protein
MRLQASRTQAPRGGPGAACRKADFFSGTNHINGVFAADIMRFTGILAAAREFRAKRALPALLAGCFCLNDRSSAGNGKQRSTGPLFGEDA